MTVISVGLLNNGLDRADMRLDDWEIGMLDPAVDFFALSAAEMAIKVMERDAHGPLDNPHNTGGLKAAIRDAELSGGVGGSASVTVRRGYKGGRMTDPGKEANWGDRMHGLTPPPHDFMRNVEEELKKQAQAIWDSRIGGIL